LVRRAGFTGERQGFGMGINTPVDDSASQLADLAGRVAVLVMAGGSACRIPEAPCGFDPGAAAFDAALVAALGAADPAALAAMDPAVAAVLHADGRVFQLLGVLAGQATWQSRVLCDIAPYGVEYAVAVWTRA
jgi:aromatic ring-opening dioxygenase LigB subunit